MNNIYCGRNSLDEDVVNGTKIIGSPNRCLKIGIGRGLHMPYDRKYDPNVQAYQPLDNTRIYCGRQNQLPAGYTEMGKNHNCLQTGVAIGKRMKAAMGITPVIIRWTIIITIFLALDIGIFLTLFYTKPKFLLIENGNTQAPTNIQPEIDWFKFVFFFVILTLILLIILYFIFRRFYL